MLADEIIRLLTEIPFSLNPGITKAMVNAIHFEYEWDSFHPVAIPLNTQTGYCGQGLSLEQTIVESALDKAIDEEDDDFCDDLRTKMTESYVAWFKSAWQLSRDAAPTMRGFLSVHDTAWRTDLDAGEEFREDESSVKFFN